MDTVSVEIKPEQAAWGKTVKLNAIDQIAPRNHTVAYWFFKLDQGADKQRIANCMEQGLINTLAEVPQAMCSVAPGDTHREELQLVYEAAGGATFHVKDYTSSSLCDQWPYGSFQDLQRQHFTINGLDGPLTLGPIDIPGTDHTRGTVLQLNFIDGGMILTVMMHVRVPPARPFYCG